MAAEEQALALGWQLWGLGDGHSTTFKPLPLWHLLPVLRLKVRREVCVCCVCAVWGRGPDSLCSASGDNRKWLEPGRSVTCCAHNAHCRLATCQVLRTQNNLPALQLSVPGRVCLWFLRPNGAQQRSTWEQGVYKSCGDQPQQPLFSPPVPDPERPPRRRRGMEVPVRPVVFLPCGSPD